MTHYYIAFNKFKFTTFDVFFDTVYEDEVLRVVDSKAIDEDGGYTYSRRMEFVNSPALAQTEMYMQCTDEEWGRNKKDLSLDGTHAAHSTAKSSSAVSSSQLDYATLHMPVHRVIGGICADYLSRTHVKGSPEHQQRVAVIGAGCCALPAYLLMHDSSSGIEDKFNERGGSSGGDPTVSRSWSSTRSPFKDQLAVHAVEPCAEVLDAAEKFFGIHFDLHRLVKHVETGSQYLRGAVGVQCSIASEGKDEGMMEGQHRYHDVIIIDAFADGDRDANQRSNAATTVHMDCHNTDRDKDGRKDGRDNDVLLQCAPPEELLVDLPLLAAALTDPRNSTRAGLLLVNVYGPSDWVEVVVAKIESTRLFCPVLVFPTTAAAVLNAQISSNGPLSTMDSRNVVLVTAPLAVGELLVELGAVDVMSLLQRN